VAAGKFTNLMHYCMLCFRQNLTYVHYNNSVVCLRQVGWAEQVARIGENTKYFEHLIETSCGVISKITFIGEGYIEPYADPSGRAV
jgi:hypothetical protein